MTQLSTGRGAVLVFFFWRSYAALALQDDLAGAFSISAVTTVALAALVIGVATLATVAGYGRRIVLLWRPALASLGAIAVLVGFFLVPLTTWIVLTALAVAVYQALAAAGRAEPPGQR